MVAHYEMMTLKVSDLDRVKIPTFQRGFVWTAKKKNEFIETLHEGLPLELYWFIQKVKIQSRS